MFFEPRRQRRALTNFLVLLLLLVSLPAWAAEKSRLRVDDYQIDAELTPHIHKISARAKVKFTALEDLSAATFELNNGLRVTKVTDDGGPNAIPGAHDSGFYGASAVVEAAQQRQFNYPDIRI